MLDAGKKKSRFANILILVLSEKKFLNETKKHTPPFKLNGRSLMEKARKAYFKIKKISILAKRDFFFPASNIRLFDKNSESDYFFFPPPKSEYFFQQHWESEYFLFL
jgi:hypothetical protein